MSWLGHQNKCKFALHSCGVYDISCVYPFFLTCVQFQKLVSEIVSGAAGIAHSDEMLSGLFDAVHLHSANIFEPDQTAGKAYYPDC